MPRGDTSAYTPKQQRRARRIEEGYLRRGVPEEQAERRAWATEGHERRQKKRFGRRGGHGQSSREERREEGWRRRGPTPLEGKIRVAAKGRRQILAMGTAVMLAG